MGGRIVLAYAIFGSIALAQAPKQRPQAGKLKVGDAVPALTLQDLAGKNKIKLTELHDKPTVLIFGSCT